MSQTPQPTWGQAHKAVDALAQAMYELVPATMQRLGLPIIEPEYGGGEAQQTAFYDMRFHAHFGQIPAFIEAYNTLEAELAKPAEKGSRLDFLRLIRQVTQADDDDNDPDNTGMRVAPKWTPPASDQEPDGADDLTRWLERQMKRRAT